jgi:argininosuccinate synthase
LKLSRQEEVDYLSKTECTILGKSPYSINKGLWGQVGGKETLTSNQPLPSDAYPSTTKEKKSYATI